MNVYKVTAPVLYVEARDEDAAAEIAIEHLYSFPKGDYYVELDTEGVDNG